MSGFYKGMQYLANGTNRSLDTKQSILFIATADQKIKVALKERKEEKEKSEEIGKFEFDPKEVETIVLQSKDGEER